MSKQTSNKFSPEIGRGHGPQPCRNSALCWHRKASHSRIMLLLVSARRRASAIRVHRRSCSSSAKKSPEIRLVCKSQRQRSLEGRGRLLWNEVGC